TASGAYVANFEAIPQYTITIAPDDVEKGTVSFGSRGGGDEIIYDFEDGWQGWTTFQGNTTSPHSWMHNTAYTYSSNDFTTGYGYNSSDGFMLSESYISGTSSGAGTAVTPDNYLVSPQVRLGGSISFYAGARNTSYCAEKFSVMVSTTDNTNPASFTIVGTWTLSLSQAGYNSTPYTVDLSSYSGMGYVAIRHFDCTDQWFLCIDNVTITQPEVNDGSVSATFYEGETCTVVATPNADYTFAEWKENGTSASSSASYTFTVTGDRDLVANFSQTLPLPCPVPTDLTIGNVDRHSAELSWTELGEATSWVVAYKPAGTETFTEVNVAEPTCTLTGLADGTSYEVMVRPVCESGVTDSWSEEVSFTTESCFTIALDDEGVWGESFDSYTTSTTSATGEELDCWEVVWPSSAGGLSRPQLYYNSDFAHDGGYTLRMSDRCVYALPELSPELELQSLRMEFYVRQPSVYYQLEVGVWDEAVGTFEPVALANNATTGVERFACDFSGYTGEGRRIAFRNSLNGGRTWSYSYNYIDAIILTDRAEVSCGMESLPYAEYFEGYTGSTVASTGVEPDCWELVKSDAGANLTRPQLYYNSTYGHSGDYSLRMSDRCVYALPELPAGTEIGTLRMELYVRQPYSYYQLEVGVWDEESETFEAVAVLNNATTGVEYRTCDFTGYTGQGHRIAFRNSLNGGRTWSYSYNYIDNVVLREACELVTESYREGFEGYTSEVSPVATGVSPACWEVVQEEVVMSEGGYPQVYYTSEYAHDGSYSLRMSDRCVYAMPELGEGVELSGLRMRLYVRQPYSFYQLEVGVWDEESGFTRVKLINNATTGVTMSEVDFTGYTGRRIAFRNSLNSGRTWSYSYNYIDDISFTDISTKSEMVAGDVFGGDAMDTERYLDNISVYPNPTTGVLHIDAVDVQKVECYSQMGQLVGVYDNVNDLNIGELA
ncbi:MAG: choice-of-anchor J domain-containing protein, partial [Bacteroidaceae bacterium]|nr:choice-of-anchor J domain-containing protein [Bacteroidaceae bacterium]